MTGQLHGKVALVAGATRGAGRGIAVELGAAGATVYGTGRSTRAQRSDYDRPETIEDTAELVTAAGGTGIAVQVDHTDPDQVRELIRRIEDEQGRLDVLVNDLGGEHLMDWDNPILWKHDLHKGIQRLRVGIEAHMITAHFALGLLSRRPGGLVVELTDGTAEIHEEYYRSDCGAFFDIAKTSMHRLARAEGEELREFGGTAVSLTPGWLRSEMMLDHFGVTEENWRESATAPEGFGIAESPAYIGRAVVALATDPDVARWNTQSLSSGFLAKTYGFTDTDGSQPDAWRYIQEVEWPGNPGSPDDYR
ncbi:NAD(P)-dependent dehydrogenase, short-chain alcohol dehydrogenase family [Saccharopolyspora kobensis]|uniref:NAD(P)-dependent dehydrogenase, short-chain alcohol dehydrogenase family n=1 Tax=Saccharopolyspora kobensis TaxID=146035 RepID=A0A1H6C047_9PSEU|nr:SDR family oxidoreductase [Saccharopolyspora kobensis]SEG66253.1 NAD(P)-dependent dehydrogenase, short-chain alcohol dehydrogenase family [Saccharopolyspora kobensis]SFC22487.1 NAD(P)-dependent dehydrogenase, short-chain alcohol dehydrogenase family [Saccharopolyspora kobensis]